MWHGQHFMTPFIKRPCRSACQGADFAPSRRRDQRDRGRAARGRNDPRLGRSWRADSTARAAVGAFLEMLGCAREGYNVALTADVPKVSPRRRARASSGSRAIPAAPIYPVALATSRRIELDNWDRTVDQPAVQPRRAWSGRRSAFRADARRRNAGSRPSCCRKIAQRRDRPRLCIRRRNAAGGGQVAERNLPVDLARLSCCAAGAPLAPLCSATASGAARSIRTAAERRG